MGKYEHKVLDMKREKEPRDMVAEKDNCCFAN